MLWGSQAKQRIKIKHDAWTIYIAEWALQDLEGLYSLVFLRI